MEGDTIHLNDVFEAKKSGKGISILVVDDDSTCLAILSSILRKFKYRVVTFKYPTDALHTLRINGDDFDLVISDVHMPDMNGFELQQAIAQEFQIPVILMSADNNEGIASKGSICGAACFILKPIKPDDLRDLWRLTHMKKKTQAGIIQEEQSVEPSNSTTMTTASNSSAVTTNGKNKKRRWTRNEGCHGKQGESSQPSPMKKPKIIWTNSLHNRFLEALRNIGLDRAVPKRILEFMNVPGLTRENVASHLQKYRIFLRRVTDASFKMQHGVDGLGLGRSMETNVGSLGASSSNTILSRFTQPSTPLQDLEPSSNSFATQPGFGQSRLVSSQASLVKPTIENPSWFPPQNDLQAYLLSNTNYENPIYSIPSHHSSLPSGNFSGFLKACLDTPVINKPSPSFSSSSQDPNGILNFGFPGNYMGYIFGTMKHVVGLGQPEDHHALDSSASSIYDRSSAMASTRYGDVVNQDQLVRHLVHMPQYDLLFDRQQHDHFTTFADPRNLPNELNGGGIIIANSNFCDGVTDWNTILQSSDAVGNQASFSSKQSNSPSFHVSQQLGNSCQLIKTVVPPSNKQLASESFIRSLRFGPASQINMIPQSPAEQNEEEFLNSLIAPSEEDPTLTGI